MKKIIMLIVCALFVTTVTPIGKKQAYTWAAVGGGASALATGMTLNHFGCSKKTTIGASAVVGLLATLISSNVLVRYTPERKTAEYVAKCAEIYQTFDTIEKDLLINHEYSMPDELLAVATIRFGTASPLYLAKKQLMTFTESLVKSSHVLQTVCSAHQVLLHDDECKKIFQDCRDGIETKTKQLSQRIALVLDRIVQNPKFREQAACYKVTDYKTQCEKVGAALYAVKSDFLIRIDPGYPEDILVRATTAFGTSWPLVLARDHIIKLSRRFTDISADAYKADQAYQDLQKDPDCKDYFENCQRMNNDMRDLWKRIEDVQKLIITHPFYSNQVELYENHIKYEREMEAKRLELAQQVKIQEMAHQEKMQELTNQKQIKELQGSIEKLNKEIQKVLEQNKHLQSFVDKNKYRGETCSICQDNYRTGQTVGILSCNHVFHKDCVATWLNNYNRTCPLCRAENARINKQEVVQ